ncbi:regulation of nuclear pre-mRNA domain-containing protein 2-like isoform X2 [Juglans microcarpa x Juglans regia]|uniref:regulation of nuclear pre-mRNA domain-containing protein 2-like isoform X2 n=1 Tax=Juglans microcarpa x Juglans regia TaxID=2249226 RepID=UPI001B7F5DAB|nr:regulation of nuclear pre-mRNA domain-containing protein 2-like isoform X2 [Juglans microcarpa x Juglans regia]
MRRCASISQKYRTSFTECKNLVNTRMSNSEFDGQILVGKLSKLNNSQQSIESLSHWCISHRKKAKQIVETWDKLFNSSQREQRVSFLYLANDILQNSRRKGSEFVSEFWKVLPAALCHVYKNGDEHGKKAVTRLVDIWEERKVFGSRGRSLKDEMLGKNPPPLVNSGKSSNPIKIVKRDANSVRIKLAVGGLLEKIFTAFQSVLDEYPAEEVALSNCNATVHHVGIIGQDVESALTQGNQQGSAVVDELQEQEVILKQCVGQLESAEATRASLISQLKEALQDQESKLEFIRTQLQVARDQIEQASKIRKRLTSPTVPCPPATTMNPTTEATRVVEQNLLSVQSTSTLPQTALMQPPVVSFAPTRTTEEENKKSAAAAVAAKLAASASSAQMLTSVLSSLVAEEVASMNGSINSTGFSSALSMFPPEKRPKLEKPMPVSDESSSDVSSTTYFASLQQQPMTNVPPAPSTSSSQASQMQGPFAALPSPPPPPPLSPANLPASQYVQSAGLVVMPYGYGANTLPPPPPLPPHVTMSLARTAPQPPGQPQPQPQPQPQQSQQQQQPVTGGFYRPPGVGFYGQSHQPTMPPVPRQ